MKFTLRFLLTVGLAVACVWGQRGGGGGTTGHGGTSGSPGGTSSGGTSGGTTGGVGTSSGPGTAAPGNMPSINGPAQPGPGTATSQPPIFLSGRVVVDDGSPLPGSIDIQAVCGATQRIVDHTGANGDFAFKWSFTMGATFEDASENGSISRGGSSDGGSSSSANIANGGLPGDPLAGCDLRAVLSGYSSSRVSLYNHREFDASDIGTITLHRLTGDEGRTVSALSLNAPKAARKDFDKGAEQVRAHKTAEAAASFRKAVAAYPQYADAWLELGKAQLQLGSRDDARADFQKAMDLDNKLVGPWQELGFMASDDAHWSDASKYLDQAVKLDPLSSPMTWYFDAVANFNQHQFDVAERSIRAEMKLNTTANPQVEYLLGMVLIARKDLAGGATVLRKFVDTYPDASETASAKKILASADAALAAAPHQ